MKRNDNLQIALVLRPYARQSWIARFLLAITLCVSASAAAVAQTNLVVQGTVSVSSTDGPAGRLPGASVTLTSAKPGETPQTVVTNEQGEYKFTNVAPGTYTVQVDVSGFKQQTKSVVVQAGINNVDDIKLELEVLSAEVTVVSSDAGLETTGTAAPTSLKQQTLQNLPLENEQFQDAIPLVPGVVRGADGLLNMKGARSSQSGFHVNSANGNDPVTGESTVNLPLEAVESVQVVENPYSPEYGQFTGAVTEVQTKSGAEKFNVNAESFFPRVRRRGGHFVGIEAFTPRVTFSGPLVKDKLRFMQSFEYRFVRTPVENLPPLKRDTDLESFDSVSQIDWDVSDKNHLSSTFSLFPQKLRYVGLNTFNQQEVTPNFKQRGWLWSVNDRHILNSRSVLESSFSVKQYDADVFPSSGTAPMNFAPNENSGSFFNQQYRNSRRYQALEVYSFTPPKFLGEHFVRVGGGINYNTFDGRNFSNSVRILRANGTRSQQIDFVGSGQLNRNQTQVLAYFQDKWTVNPRLTFDYGVRYDRDNIASENSFAPRLSFAFLPFLDRPTVIRGGIGLFYDNINLNVATFGQLQNRLITDFGADGQAIVGTPQLQRLTVFDSNLRTPRSVNWNIQFDREWLPNLMVRVGYQQRQAHREFVINPLQDQNRGSQLLLDNSGSSRYRELELTAKYNFREHDEIIASYVRSSAIGDLNDFNSYFGNFQNPIIRANERSRLPYDVPNRFLLRGELHTKYKFTVAPVVDVRTGFPYSVIDENRNFVGPRNLAGRYPTFFSLDLQVLKTISLPGPFSKYRANLGLKVFNLTNHFNPRDFQNNLASDSFGNFTNGVGVKFGTRISFSKK